jgi:hypothetical protein
VESRAIRALILCAAVLLAAGSAFAAVREQTGTFAYHGLRQRVSAQLARTAGNELELQQYYKTNGTIVTRYMPVGGAPVHLFLVRDDFRTFTHMHPQSGGNGHFRVSIALDANHRYYAYVDSFVTDIGEQAFRFTLQNGAPPHHLDVTLERPTSIAAAGPYHVTLSKARFRANIPVTLSATVTRGARMIKPPNHASFRTMAAVVNTGSLQYVSVYEGRAAGLWYPGEYDRPQIHLPALPRGLYRMWLMLTIENTPYTAAFTLAAQ